MKGVPSPQLYSALYDVLLLLGSRSPDLLGRLFSRALETVIAEAQNASDFQFSGAVRRLRELFDREYPNSNAPN